MRTRKTVTVVFTDVVGSTSLAERVDPEPLRTVMDRYFERMRSILERHGGTVEKYIGDAVMAVFGIPAVHEDDALRAVVAAAEMREALLELNSRLERDLGVRIETRTGVNTGEVLAGDSGSAQSFATGDAVNVAARLQQAASPGEILIGGETWRLVRDAATGEPVEPLALKGKADAVTAVRLIDVAPGVPGLSRLDSPMVGREPELAALQQAFQRSVDRPGCELVTVFGDAGVGKSRLTHEFLSRLVGRAGVLRARCLPYGEGITFWPIAELVKEAAGITEADSPDQVRLRIGGLVADVEDAGLIGARVAAAVGLGEGSGVIQETFWAVRRLLEALARTRPLAVVFDDIQWAEPAFLDLVEYVANFSKSHPLHLACLARPDLRDVRPGWGGSGTLIALDPLSGTECERLIEGVLGEAELPEEARDRITEAAEGNPLFVGEMLRMLVDDGLLARDDGHWAITEDLTGFSPPSTIQALLAARLDRLDDEERAVIQRASLVGRVFYWGAVAELSPEDQRADVGAHLQALLRKELIRPDESTFAGEDAFRFSHILVRDAAYDSMAKQVRADLHERFAAWLERHSGDRVTEYEEIIGYHLERAYQYRTELGPVDEAARALAVRAAERLDSSGRRAFGRSDMTAAVGLLSRALFLLPEEEPLRHEILPDLAVALLESGELSRAKDVLRTADQVASAAASDRLAAHALVVRLRLSLFADPDVDMDAVGRQAEQAVKVFEGLRDERGLARAWNLIAWMHGLGAHAALRQEALERALEHARRAGDRQEETESLGNLSSPVIWGPMHVDEGLRRLKWLFQEAGGDRKVEALVLWAEAVLRAMQGRFEEGRGLAARSRAILEDLGRHVDAVTAWAEDLYVLEMLAGDPAAAEPELRRAVEALEAMGETSHLSTQAACLADAIYAQGRYEEAERFTRISEEAAAKGDMGAEADWRRVRAKILARRGRFDEAEAMAREAVRIYQLTDYVGGHATACMDLAEVFQLVGRPGEARPHVERAIQLLGGKGNVVGADKARTILDELSGEPPDR
jgi:class 3 adenylate cyclase/tetratricopeptide (TPR) repeat protein